MKAATATTFSERVGQLLGRAYCSVARKNEMAIRWLAVNGFSVRVATILLWFIKLCLLVVLFYSLFWIGLIVVFMWVVGKLSWIDFYSLDHREAEWRMGAAGFGLYTSEGLRIDPHVQDDD